MKSFNDIDAIRSEWNKLSNSNLKKFRTTEEIEAITKQKSRNEIDKMKRKFIIENAIGFPILIIWFIYVNIWGEPLESLIFNVLFGCALVITIFVLIPLKKIGKMNESTIREFLTNTVSVFRKSYKTLVILSIIIFPICFVGGFAMGLVQDADMDFINKMQKTFCSTFAIVKGAGIFVLVSFLGYFGIRWYYKKMYLQHISNLENMLNELDKIEEEEECIN